MDRLQNIEASTFWKETYLSDCVSCLNQHEHFQILARHNCLTLGTYTQNSYLKKNEKVKWARMLNHMGRVMCVVVQPLGLLLAWPDMVHKLRIGVNQKCDMLYRSIGYRLDLNLVRPESVSPFTKLRPNLRSNGPDWCHAKSYSDPTTPT